MPTHALPALKRAFLSLDHRTVAPVGGTRPDGQSSLPLPAGSRTITNIDGQLETVTWGDDAPGSGLANAAAAVAGTP